MSRVDLDSATIDDFRAKFKSDAFTVVNAARMAAEIEQATIASTNIVVTIYDKFYKPMWECGNYIALSASWPRNQIQAGGLTLAGNDPAVDHILNCHETTVPITIEVGRLLWSGRIKVAHDNFGEPGQDDTVVCELEGDYAWLHKILAWPNFLMPLQVQLPSKGVAIGPAVSVLKYILGTQCFRLQSGLYDLINSIGSLNFDWHDWFATALMQNENGGIHSIDDVMRMLRMPVYVVPQDVLHDTSAFISVTWRMDKIASIFEQQLKDNGLVVEAYLWRVGDPQPSSDAITSAYPLTVPTIVIDIKDRRGITGPTGTFLDGIVEDLVDLEGSMFGEVLDPFLNPDNEYKPYGWNIAPVLGVDFVKPWVVLNGDDPKSGVKGTLSHHTPESWRVMVGGKSPKWLNDLINATLAYALDMIMMVIGITGISSNLLDGLFNDVLLAFQLADNYSRRVKMGPYGYPEIFVPTGTAPYSIDAVFALIRAQWDTRGYVAAQATFQNGFPYEIGRDIIPGALATLIRRNKVYTDYIENITLEDNDKKRCEVNIQLGDGKKEEAPIVRAQRKISQLGDAVNALTMVQST